LPTEPPTEPDAADYGLLSPAWAGTAVAAATGDRALIAALLDVEVALADAYADLGIGPDTAPASVRAAASRIVVDPAELAERARGGGNPVIPLVADLRSAVAADDERAAQWVHRGATSQDILDTALMLVARRAVTVILEDAASIVRALRLLTDRHRGTLTVARTLTQHGVPSTFGLKVAGWLHGVHTAARRLTLIQLPVQWGGAGGTLASFSVIGSAGTGLQLADSLAARLGLAAPAVPWQSQRGPVTALGDALATLSDALGTIAGNVALLSRPEIAELGEPAAEGRGVSSAMPQKHNPVLSVLILAAARRAPGLAAELHHSAMTVDDRPAGAWHAEWPVLRELLRQVAGAASAAAELTSGLIVNEQAMRRNAELTGPLIVSERLMLQFGDLIGRERLRELVVGGGRLAESLRAEPALASVTDDQLAAALDPALYLGATEAIIDRVLAESAHGVES
jgi:3-carboxy-cis,cis-muconate cycloisomerase